MIYKYFCDSLINSVTKVTEPTVSNLSESINLRNENNIGFLISGEMDTFMNASIHDWIIEKLYLHNLFLKYIRWKPFGSRASRGLKYLIVLWISSMVKDELSIFWSSIERLLISIEVKFNGQLERSVE